MTTRGPTDERTRPRSQGREFVVLVGFAGVLLVGLGFAVNSYGLSCDYLGEAPSFLCRHERTRLLVYLAMYLGLAVLVARRIHPMAREVAPWSALPLFAVLWASYEWGRRGGLVHSWATWSAYSAVALVSVILARRKPNP